MNINESGSVRRLIDLFETKGHEEVKKVGRFQSIQSRDPSAKNVNQSGESAQELNGLFQKSIGESEEGMSKLAKNSSEQKHPLQNQHKVSLKKEGDGRVSVHFRSHFDYSRQDEGEWVRVTAPVNFNFRNLHRDPEIFSRKGTVERNFVRQIENEIGYHQIKTRSETGKKVKTESKNKKRLFQLLRYIGEVFENAYYASIQEEETSKGNARKQFETDLHKLFEGDRDSPLKGKALKASGALLPAEIKYGDAIIASALRLADQLFNKPA